MLYLFQYIFKWKPYILVFARKMPDTQAFEDAYADN